MHELMKLAWESWVDTREETFIFIDSLSAEDLTRKIPRPGLDSFGYHFQELGVIQSAFSYALQTGAMDYSKMGFKRDVDLYSNHDQLKDFLAQMDAELKNVINCIDKPLKIINWNLPRNPTGLEHVFWLMQHETLHHGQLMAFCYVMGIKIPPPLEQHWNMPPVDTLVVDRWLQSKGWKRSI